MPITTPYTDDEAGGRQKQPKTVIRQPRTKTNTIRQARSDWSINARSRQRRHDPKTPAQMRIRGFMFEIQDAYYQLDEGQKAAWWYEYPTFPHCLPLEFFRINLLRLMNDSWITMWPPTT